MAWLIDHFTGMARIMKWMGILAIIICPWSQLQTGRLPAQANCSNTSQHSR